MHAFTLAYIECALWSSTDESGEAGGECLDLHYDARDLAAATLAAMVTDCDDFREYAKDLLAKSGLSDEQAGHDFWLTRNGHGAGFWDRGLGVVGDELTKAAKSFGERNLYVGDDGMIYGG